MPEEMVMSFQGKNASDQIVLFSACQTDDVLRDGGTPWKKQ